MDPNFFYPWSIQPPAFSDAAQGEEAASPVMPCPTEMLLQEQSCLCLSGARFADSNPAPSLSNWSTAGAASRHIPRDAEHLQLPMKAKAW